jgi:exopolysaccharide production protein ExoZ
MLGTCQDFGVTRDRLHALDLCRGACAAGVATYHLSMWLEIDLTPAAKWMLSLFGTYGVSVFFVLSGYCLTHAYRHDFLGRVEAGPFAAYLRRRIGRLAPLFFVALLATTMGRAIFGNGALPDLLSFLVNATLLFGFADPNATPVIGGWSIGVEAVFYVVFPLLLALREKPALMLGPAVLLSAAVSAVVAQRPTLPDAWNTYVSPANHWIFFCSGAYASLWADRWRIDSRCALVLLAISFALAVPFLLDASELQLVTGWRRLVMVMMVMALVASLGQIAIRNKGLRAMCSAMGGASYPLYLLHPIVYLGVRHRMEHGSASWWLGIVIVSIWLAFLADRYIDAPIQRKFKRLGW